LLGSGRSSGSNYISAPPRIAPTIGNVLPSAERPRLSRRGTRRGFQRDERWTRQPSRCTIAAVCAVGRVSRATVRSASIGWFAGGKNGDLPSGALAFDTAGNLYGVTLFGGGKGTSCDIFYGGTCGTVFKLHPSKTKGGKWTEKVLHSFAGIAGGKQNGDGAEPNGGLVLDSRRNVFGTTDIGGQTCPGFEAVGCGTVFELSLPTQKSGKSEERVLPRLTRGKDGAGLSHGLTVDANGALYGTTELGGTQDSGVVFRFTQQVAAGVRLFCTIFREPRTRAAGVVWCLTRSATCIARAVPSCG
jgi:uncharacterized repeat protein (TIGR03803 family)